MSKISAAIPPQAFELIRDRIGEILIDEIPAQGDFLVADFNDDYFTGGGAVNIFIERIIPPDKTEMPAINISLARGTYDNKHAVSADGNYIYNIDCYTAAKTSQDGQGDSIASTKLQRLLGICRGILENPIYRTLGFQAPFISRVFCSEISIADPGRQDAISTMMGRLTFNVRVPETVSSIEPKLIIGYETKVKIGTGNYGYVYKGGS